MGSYLLRSIVIGGICSLQALGTALGSKKPYLPRNDSLIGDLTETKYDRIIHAIERKKEQHIETPGYEMIVDVGLLEMYQNQKGSCCWLMAYANALAATHSGRSNLRWSHANAEQNKVSNKVFEQLKNHLLNNKVIYRTYTEGYLDVVRTNMEKHLLQLKKTILRRVAEVFRTKVVEKIERKFDKFSPKRFAYIWLYVKDLTYVNKLFSSKVELSEKKGKLNGMSNEQLQAFGETLRKRIRDHYKRHIERFRREGGVPKLPQTYQTHGIRRGNPWKNRPEYTHWEIYRKIMKKIKEDKDITKEFNYINADRVMYNRVLYGMRGGASEGNSAAKLYQSAIEFAQQRLQKKFEKIKDMTKDQYLRQIASTKITQYSNWDPVILEQEERNSGKHVDHSEMTERKHFETIIWKALAENKKIMIRRKGEHKHVYTIFGAYRSPGSQTFVLAPSGGGQNPTKWIPLRKAWGDIEVHKSLESQDPKPVVFVFEKN